MYIGLHIYPYLIFIIFNLYGKQLQYEITISKQNHNTLLFVIKFFTNFNHFKKITENSKKIYVNITHNSYSIETTMYSILLSPAGGLHCTVH